MTLGILAIGLLSLISVPDPPPQIRGILLQTPKPLPEFELRDHHNQTFTREELLGRWHILSYGFTSCPDICPTTLACLARVAKQLSTEELADLRFLFYTVDHRRDTSAKLSIYLPYFHPDFLGLTHLDDSTNPHLPFEKGLGITAQLTPLDEMVDGKYTGAYSVAHGVMLYVINPRGELQAILEPRQTRSGIQHFEMEEVLRDYRAIRDYLG